MRGLPRGERWPGGGEVVSGGEGSSVGERAVFVVAVVAGLSCVCPSGVFQSASSLRFSLAKSPDSSPASLLSTFGEALAGVAAAVLIAASGAKRCPGRKLCLLAAKGRSEY